MTLHKPAFVASNKSSDSKEDNLEGGFFFFGGDLSWFAGVRSIYCNGEKTGCTKTLFIYALKDLSENKWKSQ